MIRLTLLGPTACLDAAGIELERIVRSPKRLALLAYLAAASPRGFHRRDTLLGLFWPESDQQRARGALRQTVRHLRSDLGDVIVGRGQEELGLDVDRFWCDVAAFEDALDGGRESEAMELYRSDLLDGFYLSGAPEFERWLDGKRTRLRRRCAKAAWTLAQRTAATGEAARWARRAVRLTPRDETAIRRLMQLLDDRGDAVGALREYERFRSFVHEEFGAGPGPETRALAGIIRGKTETSASEAATEGKRSGSETARGTHSEPRPRRRGLVLPVHRPHSFAAIRPERDIDVVSEIRPAMVATPRERRTRALRRGYLAAGLTVAALATVGTSWLLNGDRSSLRFSSAVQLTDLDGIEVQPAISPSGDRVAYAVGDVGALKIEVRRVAGGRPMSLSEDIAGTHGSPTWDPTGERVAFLAYEESGGSVIYAVHATGGPPRVLLRSEPGQGLDGLSWSPEGERIALKRNRGLYTLEVATGELTHLADAWAPHSLAWSPDGRWIAFVSENPEYPLRPNVAPSSIWVVAVNGSEPQRITTEDGLNQSPVWWPDGRGLFFVSDRDGTADIYSMAVSSEGHGMGQPERLTTGLDLLTFSISGDGRRLAYSKPAFYSDIWTLPIHPDGGPAEFADARRLLSRRQVIETVSLSPDGRWVAFDSHRGGDQDIYKVPVDGGNPVRLTRDKADDFAPDWSPDGSEIVFYSFRNGNRDLFVMDSDGRGVEQVTASAGSDAFPTWSPEGRSIVYQHNPSDSPGDFPTLRRIDRSVANLLPDQQGTNRVDGNWIPPRALNDEWSEKPRWSPDGRWIAYNGIRKLMVISALDGTVSPVIQGITFRGASAWSPDSESLYFAGKVKDQFAIWEMPRAGGEPILVAVNGEGTWGRFWFDTDGEKLVFTLFESRESDIWVVELEEEP